MGCVTEKEHTDQDPWTTGFNQNNQIICAHPKQNPHCAARRSGSKPGDLWSWKSID